MTKINANWIDRMSNALTDHLDQLLIQSRAYPLLQSINQDALDGKGKISLDELNGKDQRLYLVWTDRWNRILQISVVVRGDWLYVNGKKTNPTSFDMKHSLLDALKEPETVRTDKKTDYIDLVLVFLCGVLVGGSGVFIGVLFFL